MKTLEDFEHLVENALGEQNRGESIAFATVERKSGGSDRQHSLYEHRSRQSPRGNRFHLDRAGVAAHCDQHGSEISHAAARLRNLAMHSCRAQNGRVESAITQRDSAYRRHRRRHTAQTPDHLDGPRARHRLLQYLGYRMAGGKGKTGRQYASKVRSITCLRLRPIIVFLHLSGSTDAFDFRPCDP